MQQRRGEARKVEEGVERLHGGGGVAERLVAFRDRVVRRGLGGRVARLHNVL